jgi:hypothetical protein
LQESDECLVGGGGDYAVPEQAQLVGSIVTGDEQLGMVQPMGRFIKVSTQRGFNLPASGCRLALVDSR